MQCLIFFSNARKCKLSKCGGGGGGGGGGGFGGGGGGGGGCLNL